MNGGLTSRNPPEKFKDEMPTIEDVEEEEEEETKEVKPLKEYLQQRASKIIQEDIEGEDDSPTPINHQSEF